MATGSWATTDEEDAAIAAVEKVTPGEFVADRLRHQLRFVVEQHRGRNSSRVAEKYDALPAEKRAAVDVILNERASLEGGAKR